MTQVNESNPPPPPPPPPTINKKNPPPPPPKSQITEKYVEFVQKFLLLEWCSFLPMSYRRIMKLASDNDSLGKIKIVSEWDVNDKIIQQQKLKRF